MKNLSSYNVITFFNYLKIRELMKEDYKRHYGFYDISADAEEVIIENAIKAFGLYPLPFFSLHASEQNIVIEETSAIKNIWLNAHFQSFILGEHTGVTINSNISDPETLHGPLCLKDQHWSLLNTDSKNHFVIVDSLFKMIKKSHHSGVLPPPRLNSNQTIFYDRLFQTKLPHDCIAALTGLTVYRVKQLRKGSVPEIEFLRKTKIQKHLLERYSFDRYFLYVATRFFELLLNLGLNRLEAFIKTVEAFEHSPTVLANHSKDCHPVMNLYHWFNAKGLIPYRSDNPKSVVASDFPSSLHAYFDDESTPIIPKIKRMGPFLIPHHFDQEHKRLIKAINSAIKHRLCFKTVLNAYIEGAFK